MPGAEEWKSRAIYQILTDRFAVTGHGDGGPDIDYTKGQWCGGTWQGIISKLDYIQGLGFDAIWISPVTKCIEDNTFYGYGYHGYWQEDMYSVNPHFGTAEDLLALSDALHARGMYLMVDVVVNHMAAASTKVDFSRYVPFNDSSYFHSEAFITDYDNQQLVEHGWLGDSNVPLPDLHTEDPTVAHTLHAWVSALVQKFRIDGLRIDAVKHVSKSFWPGFVRAAGVWSVGEVLSGDPNYLNTYQPYVGGLLDYATYYPLKRAFKSGEGSMYEITNLLLPNYRSKFEDMQQLATFMENHDMPRFPHDTSSDVTVVKNALCWTILTDGIPVLYYGQEQMFSGHPDLDADPGARELMWKSGFKITPLYTFIAQLNKARKLAWPAGFSSNLTSSLWTDVNAAVTQKGPLLMVLSNQGAGSKSKKIVVQTKFANGTVLVDVLTGRSVSVKTATTFTIVEGQPQIYLPYQLATEICAHIIEPPMSPAVKFFAIFHFFPTAPKPPRSDVKSWSNGVPANTTNILKPPMLDFSAGRILQPPPGSLDSPYSIFGLNNSSASSRSAQKDSTAPPGLPHRTHPAASSQPWSSAPDASRPRTPLAPASPAISTRAG
ncbi:alpha amylase [Phlyctema vagabunda]|uniref:Alpha-amylase n=1 Tax=Phlyctema vagabunda TaxID=108571 RepID=A0ABR4PD40_9HELO